MKINTNKTFETDNLIYNRYDLLFSDYEQFYFEWENEKYSIMLHQDTNNLFINLWGKILPQNGFEKLIDELLEKEGVKRISIIRSKNNFSGMLEETNDIKILLPESVDELTNRLQKKHRYNLRREKRILKEALGEIYTIHYDKRDISDEMVTLFFQWKKKSHGTIYGITEKEYIDTYHITDAFALMADTQMIGVAFYCVVQDVAYFENFSYDGKYKDLSVGYITYELLLEHLISQKINCFYLGGGNYDYKRKFGAIETVAYSGHIYSKDILMIANRKISEKSINNTVIYGIGKYGNEFIRLVNSNHINVNIVGAIDKDRKGIANIHTYTLEDEFPEADAAIITMKNRIAAVEELLRKKYRNVIYMNDLLGV